MGDAETTAAAAAEARWRNYQHLIWTQQQIQLQIQQQHHQQHQQPQQQTQHQNVKMELEAQNGGITNHSSGGGGSGHQQQQPQQQQSLPLPPESTATEEKAAKADGMDPWDNFDAQAAFLGPTLWDKRLPYDGQDFKLEYVDLEEFLTENGIPVEQQQHCNANGSQHPPGSNASSGGSSTTSSGSGTTIPPTDSMNNSSGQASPSSRPGVHTQHSQQPTQQQQQSTPHHNLVGQYGPGPSVRNSQGHNSLSGHVINHPNLSNPQNLLRGPPSINAQSEHSRSPSPCGSSISRSSDDSSSSMHHGKSLRNKCKTMGVKFTMLDIPVASIPGHEFDPRTRIFTEDELKPQPMIKKSKKQFVPDEQKDAKYWARRRKNNMAAKRSRDARRVKENQIAMRACFLEKENTILKSEIDRIQKENIVLKEQLSCCRRDH